MIPTLPSHPTNQRLALEVALRSAAVMAYVILVIAVVNGWRADPGRWSLLALLAIETFTMFLLVMAREARTRDMSAPAALATGLATFYFVFLSLAPGRHAVPESIAVAIQVLGMVWQIWAKYTLGRSFGLLPADRGVVTGGPYALVRHPIYLGYLVSHIGFLLANLSWRNAAVLIGLYALQVGRMVFEERLLKDSSPSYRTYAQKVRWRFLPGIY